MATSCYTCPLCSFLLPTVKLYVGHLRVTYAKEKTFSILCEVSGCTEVFRTFSAFNSHIYHHHRAEVGIDQGSGDFVCSSITVPPLVPDLPHDESDGSTSHVSILEAHMIDECAITECHEAGTSTSYDACRTLAAAKMLLTLREGHQVSQVALAEVISGCRLLCNYALKRLKVDLAGAVNCSENSLVNLED